MQLKLRSNLIESNRNRRPVEVVTMTLTLICRYKTLLLFAAAAILPSAIKAENRPSPNYNSKKIPERDVGVNDNNNNNINKLTEREYFKCVDDLLEATDAYDFMFEIPAYLKFVEYQSNGLLVKSKFDVQILGLVHIYWFVVCNVNTETCQDDSLVSVREIIEQQDDNGVHLIHKLCKRLDVYLERNGFAEEENGAYPTMMPSLQPSRYQARFPSHSPEDRMTNHPSLEPAESFSQIPTNHQVVSDVSSTSRPTSRPSVVITSVPSKLMLERPSVQPSTDRHQFPSGMPSSQPTAQRKRPNVPSMLPSSSPTTRTITVNMSYEIEYTSSCLRFVFYEQVLMNVKDAVRCLVVGDCPYAISVLLELKERGEIYDAH